jgi:hypothetical protein
MGVGNNSPTHQLSGTYFGAAAGSLAASATDTWSIQGVLATPVQLSGSAAITFISETAGNVVTLTLVGSTFVAGTLLEISGMPTIGAWLNGYVVSLITGTAVTCTFTDPTAHGVQSSTALTGTPVLTQVSSLSTLAFTHSGSGVNASLSNPSGGLVLGTPSSITGVLQLCSSASVNPIIITPSGNVLTFLSAGGAVTLTCASGLNLSGSTGTLGLSSTPTIQSSGTNGLQLFMGANTAGIIDLGTNVAATSSLNQGATIALRANIWNGANALDRWTIANVVGTGTNPTSTLTFAHPTGTTGVTAVSFTGTSILIPTASPTSAASAGSTGQLCYDGTNLYICTAGGIATAATWKKVALTAD